jgi:hypothetical protein
MALNDILPIYDATFGPSGGVKYNTAPSATIIYPGDPVVRAAAGTGVSVMATNKPQVGTDYLVGIATTTSTNTTTAIGSLYVQPILPGSIWKMKPNAASSWNTQAKYDALCGKRVLIDLTSGTYTILAADSTLGGCVVMWKDINVDKGFVYFAFRESVTDLSA